MVAIGKGGLQLDAVLRYGELKLHSEHDCQKFLSLDKGKNYEKNSILCAYSGNCQTIFTGDSGNSVDVFY